MPNQIASVLLAALLLCVARSPSAQCAPVVSRSAGFPGVDGVVNDVVRWDPDGAGPAPEVMVVLGSFALAGSAACRNIALYDAATRTFSPLGSGTDGATRCAATLPNGDLVVGGLFAEAGGVVCGNLARWDGQSWTPLGSGTNRAVEALAVMPGGDLLVGGSFTNAGGVSASSIARWNGSTFAALSGDVFRYLSTQAGRIDAIAILPNGELAVGGRFTSVGPAPIVALARFDGTSWSAFGVGVNGSVEALKVLPDGTLVVGGNFGTAGGQVSPGLARWDGAAWSNYHTGLRNGALVGTVRSIALRPDGDLVVGGIFDRAGGTPAAMVARWDGAAWHPIGEGVVRLPPVFAADVNCVVNLPGGELLLGGVFRRVGQARVRALATWNGTRWQRVADGCSGQIHGLAGSPDGDVIAVGDFDVIGRVEANGVARWRGSTWLPLGAGPGFAADALAVLSNGDVVVAGASDVQQPSNVARWHVDRWISMPALAGDVRTLHVGRDGRLYAGGTFPGRVARWTGGGWSVLGAGVSNGPSGLLADVRAIASLPGGDLVVSGEFTTAGATPAFRFARWDGAAWFAMDTNPPVLPANAMCVLQNGDLIAAGYFLLNNLPVDVARWDGSTWQPLASFQPVTGEVEAMAVLPGGDLLLGGTFASVGTVACRNLVRWDGAAWRAVEDADDGAVLGLAVRTDGAVAIGGSFTEFAGQVSPSFAALTSSCPASVDDIGGGCVGSSGPGVLVAERAPWVGGSFDARCSGLPALSLAALVYGASPTTLALDSVLPRAVPGCTLRVAPDFVAFAVAAAGRVPTSIPIPNAISLAGVAVHHQVVPIEVDANGGIVEVTASNVLRATIGGF